MTVDFAIEPLAEDALLLRFGEGIDLATNALVHAAARALRAAALPGVVDIAPAYATLLVRLDPLTWIGEEGALPFERIGGRLRSIVEAVAAESSICGLELPPHPSPLPQTMEPFRGGGDGRESRDQGERQKAAQICATIGRVIEIPVRYGGESGPDFDAVAEHARLTREEVIERHTAAEYTVAMLGFAPGFPYLLGLDSALHMPRRANPRTRVPAGSVAIGGAQTGIYPRELPGGWQLIGRTPQVLFDPERQPPCLLAPGDRVRFVAIDSDAFTRRSGGAR